MEGTSGTWLWRKSRAKALNYVMAVAKEQG
jgi:hypothetical protein